MPRQENDPHKYVSHDSPGCIREQCGLHFARRALCYSIAATSIENPQGSKGPIRENMMRGRR